MHPLLNVLTQLASARAAVDTAFDADPRPWDRSVSGSADTMLEHLDRAIDAAVTLALGSGTTVDEIEATGVDVINPGWLE